MFSIISVVSSTHSKEISWKSVNAVDFLLIIVIVKISFLFTVVIVIDIVVVVVVRN